MRRLAYGFLGTKSNRDTICEKISHFFKMKDLTAVNVTVCFFGGDKSKPIQNLVARNFTRNLGLKLC